MERDEVDRWLEQVRFDLTDGQDLALAARLVGDAVARRARRARETLGRLGEALDDDDNRVKIEKDVLRERIESLEKRTAAFEQEMREFARRLSENSERYEDDLGQLAGELDD